jgi:hypothetical protein
MVNRQALVDDLHEIRALVWDEHWEQAHQSILLFVTQLDQLIELIHSLEGSKYIQPVDDADPFDVGLPECRSIRGFVTVAGIALKHSEPLRAIKALQEAMRTIEGTAGEGSDRT